MRLIFALALASLPARAALTANDRAAVDAYVARAQAQPKTPAKDQALDAVEAKALDLATRNEGDQKAWSRLNTFLDQRLSDVRSSMRVNLYTDESWHRPIQKDLRELCCMIKASPRLAEAIRGRVKANKRPLPFGVQRNDKLAQAFATESK